MQPWDVYIGRRARRTRTGSMLEASVWANPFVIGIDGTRAEVVEKFRSRLLESPDLLAQLPTLQGKRLACWCAPEPCHGDVLAELADAL
jgi:hypothetical protein